MSLVAGDAGMHRVAGRKWDTIRYALDDTRRTVRLCVIILTMSVASVSPFLIALLARHMIT